MIVIIVQIILDWVTQNRLMGKVPLSIGGCDARGRKEIRMTLTEEIQGSGLEETHVTSNYDS